jgi:O-antigen ligase
LGIVALVALLTFAIEGTTKSIRRETAIASVAGAVLVLILSRSPVAIGVAVVAGIAALALLGLRRIPAAQRRYWQIGLLVVATVGLVTAWLFRFRIILLLNAGSEFEYRYYLWTRAFNLAEINPIQGWGWIGRWNTEIPPYAAISQAGPRSYTTALSAYVDVYLQVGIVGLALFLGLVGLALVRSWLLASDRRSVVYLWPALVLVVLVFGSIFESLLIADWGWLLFVVATVRASKELSWRQALA